MRRFLFLVPFILFVASQAQGQVVGFPVAQSAALVEPGRVTLSAGGLVGDEIQVLYGARLGLALSEPLQVFLDIGGVEMDGYDDVPAGQVGGLLTLSSGATGNVGLRLAGYVTGEANGRSGRSAKDLQLYGAHLSLVGGLNASSLAPGVELYGALGVNLGETDASSGRTDVLGPEDGSEFSVTGGVLWPLTRSLSLYGEVSLQDSVFGGGGFRFTF